MSYMYNIFTLQAKVPVRHRQATGAVIVSTSGEKLQWFIGGVLYFGTVRQ